MGYFSVLSTLDLFLNTTGLKPSTKKNTGNFSLEHYVKVYGFYLLHQEKQVRKDSILLIFTITDFLFMVS